MPGNRGKRGGKPNYKDALGVGSLSEGAQQDSTVSAASPAQTPVLALALALALAHMLWRIPS